MQKKYTFWGMIVLAVFVMCGCANNRELIVKASHTNRNNVYSETVNPDAQPDMAIADIKFSVKSNSLYFAGTYYKHSTPPYRVNVNIDGQAMMLELEPVLEEKSPIDSSLPESGTGWKYHFNRRIALAAGKHKLTIALPVNDVIVEREVELHPGTNTISITPVYNMRSLRPYNGQNFTAGVKTLEIKVN